ncbi:hypothetical protein FAQ01_14990 [Flavobacterium aquatile]|nr:hypothetical protein FAQ01_14990 [Flavobacterium aquatile]
MIEAKRTESGNTIGIILGIANSKNFKINSISKSFPASSEMNNQTVCNMNIKNKITNTVVNVIKNVFNKYLSNIFTKG